MIIEKRLHLKSKVTALKPLEDGGLAVVDGSNAIRFLKSDSFEVVDGFKVNIDTNEQLLHGCDVSYDGKFIVFSTKKNKRPQKICFETKHPWYNCPKFLKWKKENPDHA